MKHQTTLILFVHILQPLYIIFYN